MLVTSRKPERKKGRKKKQICVWRTKKKKKEDCEHKMLKSGFAFLRNFLAPLEVDTQSSVLLLLLQKNVGLQ
jgi:hypothetical protein